jgi:polyribonucleotide nucleotidyltransferase
MDIKISGITGQIMREALEQARRGRLFILDKMQEALPESRAAVSKFAPRIHTLQIPVDKIRDLIGPGGKVIRGIVEQTGVKIDVEDSGKVNVASSDEAAMSKALQIIGDITATPEVGKTYLGKVVRLADFGAFVEIFPGTDGLLHISEIAEHRIKDVRDELHEGDQILVKVLAIEGNRIKLSRKAILREQRAKMGAAAGAGGQEGGDGTGHPPEAPSPEGGESITIEGGGDFPDGDDEPNFNRAEGEAAHAAAGDRQGPRREGGGRPHGGRGRRHHGGRRGGGGGDRNRGGGGGRH